jgi:hypothetical protein
MLLVQGQVKWDETHLDKLVAAWMRILLAFLDQLCLLIASQYHDWVTDTQDAVFCIKFSADGEELIKSVGCNGSLSLPFMM